MGNSSFTMNLSGSRRTWKTQSSSIYSWIYVHNGTIIYIIGSNRTRTELRYSCSEHVMLTHVYTNSANSHSRNLIDMVFPSTARNLGYSLVLFSGSPEAGLLDDSLYPLSLCARIDARQLRRAEKQCRNAAVWPLDTTFRFLENEVFNILKKMLLYLAKIVANMRSGLYPLCKSMFWECCLIKEASMILKAYFFALLECLARSLARSLHSPTVIGCSQEDPRVVHVSLAAQMESDHVIAWRIRDNVQGFVHPPHWTGYK